MEQLEKERKMRIRRRRRELKNSKKLSEENQKNYVVSVEKVIYDEYQHQHAQKCSSNAPKTTNLRNQMIKTMRRKIIFSSLFSIVYSFFILFISTTPTGSTLTGTGEVSFFGSSHVNVRLQEARSSSDIYFRLRTRRSDSMLFLAAGRTDYCLLVLDAGRLKVHINLGAGETEIPSEAPFLLNDMKWHNVNLTRRGSQLTIQVDHHFTKVNLPTRFHELNIHFGVWLGGLAGFSEIFLGNLPSFRGCMSQITYNGEDVLLRAKSQLGEIVGVGWNCSEEFESPPSSPISFGSDSSYLMTRVSVPRSGTTVQLDVKIETDGLLLFVSGLSSRPDYLCLQTRDGKVEFIAEIGSGPVELKSTSSILDGFWHTLIIQVSPTSLSLWVDGDNWSSEPPGRGGSRHVDVSDMIYLGGVEDSKKGKLRNLSLIDNGFKGCIRNLTIDSKLYGLPQVDVSRNISSGCSKSTCTKNCPLTNATKTPSIIKSSSSVPKSIVTKTNISHSSKSSHSPTKQFSHKSTSVTNVTSSLIVTSVGGEVEILKISPIQVAEGESGAITPRHLALLLPLAKFGIRESGVLFRVIKPPQEGKLELSSRGSGSSFGENFSLLDVGAGRVRYFHNGAENSHDTIQLGLKLSQNTGFILPSYLQDERVISLPVEITAVNDPPEIRILLPGGVLRLAEGTKIRLSPEMLTSVDPDSPPEHLNFTISPMDTGGYFEMGSQLGKPISFFTQDDLENKRIWYVDGGTTSTSQLRLQLTDGSSLSPPSLLTISTFPLRILPSSNTGLILSSSSPNPSSNSNPSLIYSSSNPSSSIHSSSNSSSSNPSSSIYSSSIYSPSSALITPYNLSFSSNGGDQGLPLVYHILRGPKGGRVEVKRGSGWGTAESFSGGDIESGRVRYVLTRTGESAFEDEFTFHVSLSSIKVPTEFRFRISVLPLSLTSSSSSPHLLLLNETTLTYFTPSSLSYLTLPSPSPPNSIKYTLNTPPQYGTLFSKTNTQNTTLSSFSQREIDTGQIGFKFTLTPYSAFVDSFTFNVSVGEVLAKGPFECRIEYSTRKRAKNVVVRAVNVVEGGRGVISGSNLRVVINEEWAREKIDYMIRGGGKYGEIGVVGDRGEFIRVERFTSEDVDKKILFYKHDGSEVGDDTLLLTASSLPASFILSLSLPISFIPVNNHPPSLSLSATSTLHVVSGGQRTLSPLILAYRDRDWDSEPKNLVYNIRGSWGGGGAFYRSGSPSGSPEVRKWTQEDVDEGRVVWRDDGSGGRRVVGYTVSDSKYTVNGTLEIIADVPWVRISQLKPPHIGKLGETERLQNDSLLLDTNVEIDEGKFFIKILTPPQHGVIKNKGGIVANFTIGELKSGGIFYESRTRSSDEVISDSFKFQGIISHLLPSIIATSLPSDFEISVYPPSYWTPLNIEGNCSVVVRENSSSIISPLSLSVSNTHIPPTDIIFTLSKPPRHGYLAIDSSHSPEDGDETVRSWDQKLVNEGRLRYVESEPNITLDYMIFNVTNGVVGITELKIEFIIIPSHLYLISTQLFVHEGGSSVLNSSHLSPLSPYYSSIPATVSLISPPLHGTLSLLNNREIRAVKTPPFSTPEIKDVNQSPFNTPEIESVITSPINIPEIRSVKTIPFNIRQIESVNHSPHFNTDDIGNVKHSPHYNTLGTVSLNISSFNTPEIGSLNRSPRSNTGNKVSFKSIIRSNTGEIGNVKLNAHSNTPEIGSVKSITRSNTEEMGSVKSITRSNTSDIGSVKSNTRSNTGEIGSVKSIIRSNTEDIGSVNALLKTREIRSVKKTTRLNTREIGSVGLMRNLVSFKLNDIRSGRVVYIHDGSESLKDAFRVRVEVDGDEGVSGEVEISVVISGSNDNVPRVVRNSGAWVWAGATTLITSDQLMAEDDDLDGGPLVFYIVGTRGGFPALVTQPQIPIHNFTQENINSSQIIFNHKGDDLGGGSFDFEVSDGLNEANKESFKISIRLPELVEYEGRVHLGVFPLAISQIHPIHLLVRSSDGREINFQTNSGPNIGQLLIERTEGEFSPVSIFTQSDINNGKIFYQHLKPFRGARASDLIILTATSRYAEPLHNISLEIDISVTGASVGGLQRYVSINPIRLQEGSSVPITVHNLNLTAIQEFIAAHQRGNIWRTSSSSSTNTNSLLKILLTSPPLHGLLTSPSSSSLSSSQPHSLSLNDELDLKSLLANQIRYTHDDSEELSDSIGLSLWLRSNENGGGGGGGGSWLLNISLPIAVEGVNDEEFRYRVPKTPLKPIVQEHWRVLSRDDLFTSDPDTPPSLLIYEILKISHGRILLLKNHQKESTLIGQNYQDLENSFSPLSNQLTDFETLRQIPSSFKFSQADVDEGRVILTHSGPLSPILLNAQISDGKFPPLILSLNFPITPLYLSPLPPPLSAPIRILQGNSLAQLKKSNLKFQTNGYYAFIHYNITRFPLHGKILLKNTKYLELTPKASLLNSNAKTLSFSQLDLENGDVAYVQTDLSVSNDSFEVAGFYNLESKLNSHAKWLVNVVSVPLLKRVKEIDSFVKGFAVGGLLAPDEFEFSVGIKTVFNLAILDASPLAAVSGSNPQYELLSVPKYGHLYRISSFFSVGSYSALQLVQNKSVSSEKLGNRTVRSSNYASNSYGRVVSRFYHEDIRRGSLIYSLNSELTNEIYPVRGPTVDEFVFKLSAPGVQPALGLARFSVKMNERNYYDEKSLNQVISDGSTDPATKRGENSGIFTGLVTPNMTKDSLIKLGVVVGGLVTITLFLVIGIRCSCVRGRREERAPPGNRLNNGGDCGGGGESKYNGSLCLLEHSSHSSSHPPSTSCPLLESDCGVHSSSSLLRPPLSLIQSPMGGESDSGSWGSAPSLPHCRVTPLLPQGPVSTCSDISSSSIPPHSLLLCPLLTPPPLLLDTFPPLPEEGETQEPYGFTYYSPSQPPLPSLSLPITHYGGEESETAFIENSGVENERSCSSSGVGSGAQNGGTLRRGGKKSQYWV